MRSKFENGKKIRFASTLKKVELYSSCLQLYLRIRNEKEFRSYMQSFCSDDTIQIILDQIHNQLRTFATIAIVEEEVDRVKAGVDQGLKKEVHQRESDVTIRSTRNQKFEQVQQEAKIIYEKAQPFLKEKDRRFAQIYFASSSNKELIKNVQEQMGVQAQSVAIMKSLFLKELKECNTDYKAWTEKKQMRKVKEKKEFKQIQQEMKPTYEKVQLLLSPKEREFAQIYFQSESNSEMLDVVTSQMGIQKQSAYALKANFLKKLKLYKSQYDDARVNIEIERKEESQKQEQFIELGEALRENYVGMKSLLTSKEREFIDIYLMSASNEELMKKVHEQMNLSLQSAYRMKYKILKEVRECKENYVAWVEKRSATNPWKKFQKRTGEFYEKGRPYLTDRELELIDLILSSDTNDEFVQKCVDKYHVAPSQILDMKRNFRVGMHQFQTDYQAWVKKQSNKQKAKKSLASEKFLSVKEEVRPTYEKIKSMFSIKRQKFAEIYFASTSMEEFLNNVEQQLNIAPQSARVMKSKLLKELRIHSDNYEVWLEKENQNTQDLLQEREELRPVYEKIKMLLSPKEREFADIYFVSNTNQMLTENVTIQMGIAPQSIYAMKSRLIRTLKYCRDHYEEWVEKKSKKKEKATMKSHNSESFLQTQEQLRSVYEKVKMLLSPRQRELAEIYFSSNTNEELTAKAVEQMNIAPQSIYAMKASLLGSLKSCLNDYDGWVKKRRSRHKKDTKKDMKASKSVKTKAEYENLYYLYQPYISSEYQKAFEAWLTQNMELVPENCIIVMNYLDRCDRALKARQSLPDFQKWIATFKKTTAQKKDATMEFLHSISREEVMTLLSKLQMVPKLPKYQRLYEFYGIDTTRHSIEQIHQKYPEISIASIKNELKQTVISIQKAVSELMKKDTTWVRERQVLLPKFTFASFELGRLEAMCVNYYYGFTVEPMTVTEIAEKVHLKEWKVEKLIQSAKSILKQSKVAKNPAILDAVAKISKVDESNLTQLQDKDFRALRLTVQQALTTDEIELDFIQEKILNLFFGFPNKPIKSSREIAELCGCTEQDARTYLIETIRYVLNYISKEDFETKFEEKKVVKQLTSVFNK